MPNHFVTREPDYFPFTASFNSYGGSDSSSASNHNWYFDLIQVVKVRLKKMSQYLNLYLGNIYTDDDTFDRLISYNFDRDKILTATVWCYGNDTTIDGPSSKLGRYQINYKITGELGLEIIDIKCIKKGY